MPVPRTYSLEVSGDFENNTIFIKDDNGREASFCQISNNGSLPVQVRLNALDTACFGLAPGNTQVFNAGDLVLDKIEFSGAGVQVDVILGL